MSILVFWSQYPAIAVAIAAVIAVAVMYLSRQSSHRLIQRISRSGHRLARILARGCAALAARIDSRNREVMLALQMEITRRQLEREFQRVAAAVEQDMTKFQHLERSINQHINIMEEDFERSAQIPPAPPGWVEAVDAIAKLQTEANPEPVGRVLQDIHTSVLDQQREVMREYRWAVNARHKILADLRPLWRGVSKQVITVGRDSRDLLGRAHRIDTQIAAFRELCANRADVRIESFLARWLMAFGLSAVALILAVLNVSLLSPSLSGLVPGTAMVNTLTAVAFTLAVMAAALVLSEAMQVSRLLPLIGGLPQRSRITVMVLSSILLLAVAGGEALLLKSGVGNRVSELSQTAAWGAASAGFVVPLLLGLLSPALEAFLATSRPVLASGAAALLTMLSMMLRIAGKLWLEIGYLTHRLYDVILFIPLAMERAIAERRKEVSVVHTPAIESAVIDSTKVRRVQFSKPETRAVE